MFGKFGTLIRAFVARLFGSGPPDPGRFVRDRKFSWRGWLALAPWVMPSRAYLVYLPRGYGAWKRRSLIVLIHGCRQTPEELAAGTRIAALADTHGWLVLLPRQTDKANSWSCWNWFDTATSAGSGEAAIVAAQVRAVQRRYRVHPRGIFVAGFSAGGCLAAVMGLRYPKLFAGVFVHSGVACGAASGPMTAKNVLRQGADTDYENIGARARADAPSGALPLPLLALHGGRDAIVAEINTLQLVRQYLVLNGRGAGHGSRSELPRPDAESSVTLPGGRTMTTADYRDGARVIVRLVRVAELEHGWSGGDAGFAYNDPKPPEATALLGEFVTGGLR